VQNTHEPGITSQAAGNMESAGRLSVKHLLVCFRREQHFVKQEAEQSAQNGGVIGYEKEAVGAKPDPL
jgi:hypothetical protein